MSWLIANLSVLAIGYCIGKVFPIPGLDSRIIAGYAAAWTWLKSTFSA